MYFYTTIILHDILIYISIIYLKIHWSVVKFFFLHLFPWLGTYFYSSDTTTFSNSIKRSGLPVTTSALLTPIPLTMLPVTSTSRNQARRGSLGVSPAMKTAPFWSVLMKVGALDGDKIDWSFRKSLFGSITTNSWELSATSLDPYTCW